MRQKADMAHDFHSRKDPGQCVFLFWVYCCCCCCNKALGPTPSPQLRSHNSVLPPPPWSTRRGQYGDFLGMSFPALRPQTAPNRKAGHHSTCWEGLQGVDSCCPQRSSSEASLAHLALVRLSELLFPAPPSVPRAEREAPHSPCFPSAGTVPGTSDVLPSARPVSEAPVLLSPPSHPSLSCSGRGRYVHPRLSAPMGPSQEDPGGNGSPVPAWGPVHPTIHRSQRFQVHQKAGPEYSPTNKPLQ